MNEIPGEWKRELESYSTELLLQMLEIIQTKQLYINKLYEIEAQLQEEIKNIPVGPDFNQMGLDYAQAQARLSEFQRLIKPFQYAAIELRNRSEADVQDE